jgi:hypothetical protein
VTPGTALRDPGQKTSQLGARLHGCAPFAVYDHFFEQQLGEPVALHGICDLPGARHICEQVSEALQADGSARIVGVQHGHVALNLLTLRKVVGARDIPQQVQVLESPQVRFQFVALLCHIFHNLAFTARKGVEALLVIVGDGEGAKKRADLFLQDG